VNWVADLDLARFFDTLPHQEILSVLALRIKDRSFPAIDGTHAEAGCANAWRVVVDELGSPQGSIVSPVIANIFLDHVLDQWFSQVVRQHCRGYCSIIRYADDTMVLFEREDDAHRFMRVLPLRLAKFGLTLNPAKTQLLRFGKQAAWQASKSGNKLPTFAFLGFTHYTNSQD
jgi:retron-type reverse transcriptase